jgi:hypothetical protein
VFAVDRVEETDTVPVDQYELWLEYVRAVNTINSQPEEDKRHERSDSESDSRPGFRVRLPLS